MPNCPILAASLVAASGVLSLASADAADNQCRSEHFRDADYTVCSFDPGTIGLSIFWQDAQGAPFRTFSALADELAEQDRVLAFAMNGGMYQANLHPVGLLIVEGKQLKHANTVDIEGDVVPNFYKKPNGVFYIADGTAGVLETEHFLAKRPDAQFATQSGPMLVVNGEIHPAFIADSPYLNQRNGVCASKPTEVHFAISDGAVNFDDFAHFFRDRLGCDNALFLDGGSAPGIYAPELGRNDLPGHGGYGPIIGVVKETPR